MALKKARKDKLISLMATWREFFPIVVGLNKEEVEFLLDHEKSTRKRSTFVARLEARLNSVSREEEKRDLVS